MATPKYDLGNRVKYKDSYWGIFYGTITAIGTQGDDIVYCITRDNGNHGTYKERYILKVVE